MIIFYVTCHYNKITEYVYFQLERQDGNETSCQTIHYIVLFLKLPETKQFSFKLTKTLAKDNWVDKLRH